MKRNRFLSIVLTLCLMLTLIPVAAQADNSTYTVTVDRDIEYGTVDVFGETTAFAENDRVTLIVIPEDGYELDTLTVIGDNDPTETIDTDSEGDGVVYRFTMPAGNVTVTATFRRQALSVSKTASYNSELKVLSYKVTVIAAEPLRDVHVWDRFDDDELEFNNDVIIAGNSSVYSFSATASDNFNVVFAEMQEGEEITFTYTANVKVTNPEEIPYITNPIELTYVSDPIELTKKQRSNTVQAQAEGQKVPCTVRHTWLAYNAGTDPYIENGYVFLKEGLNGFTGTVIADEGETVNCFVYPKQGYKLESLFYITEEGDSVEITSSGNSGYSFKMPAGDVTVSATFRKEEKPEFKGHQLVLSGQIGVMFGVDLASLTDNEKAGSYMEFTLNGKTTTVNTGYAAITADGRYYYTCYVTSIQMAEPIKAVFHYGTNGSETVENVYSVKDYIEYLDGNASEYSPAAVGLARAIADYGHYAQPFLSAANHWTIGTDYSEMTRFFTQAYDLDTVKSKVNDQKLVLTKGDSKVENAYIRLTLDSETALSVRLTVPEGTELSATGTFHGTTYQAEKQSDGSYIIKVTGIPAAWLGDTLTITGNADGDFTVTVSALSYVYTVLNSDTMSAEAKNAVASLYYFYSNTVAYRTESDH